MKKNFNRNNKQHDNKIINSINNTWVVITKYIKTDQKYSNVVRNLV